MNLHTPNKSSIAHQKRTHAAEVHMGKRSHHVCCGLPKTTTPPKASPWPLPPQTPRHLPLYVSQDCRVQPLHQLLHISRA